MKGVITIDRGEEKPFEIRFDGDIKALALELRLIEEKYCCEVWFENHIGFRARLTYDGTRLVWSLADWAGAKLGLEGYMHRHFGVTYQLLDEVVPTEDVQ